MYKGGIELRSFAEKNHNFKIPITCLKRNSCGVKYRLKNGTRRNDIVLII